jgi:hypothetical protein
MNVDLLRFLMSLSLTPKPAGLHVLMQTLISTQNFCKLKVDYVEPVHVD